MAGTSAPRVSSRIEVMAAAPLAWIFNVIYILNSSFAVLNLFIAVIVNGMEKSVTSDLVEAEEKHAADQAASDQLLLTELRELRREIAELKEQQKERA